MLRGLTRALQGVRESLTSLSCLFEGSPISTDRFPRSKHARRIRIGTFNVRSLSSQIRQYDSLPADLRRYNLDVVGLQETKICEQRETKVGEYFLLTVPAKTDKHGIGFAIAPHLRPYLTRYWARSDRVGVIQLNMPSTGRINVVCAYSPHMGYELDAVDDFYADLDDLINSFPRRDITFVVGDFNAKLGARRADEVFLGDYARGIRNRNGHALAHFCELNDLFATNTHFRKRARHLTTWTSRRPSYCIYNQIEYVLCQQNVRALCMDARSWAGTLIDSDHKLVTADILLQGAHRLRFRPPSSHSTTLHLDRDRLVHDEDTRDEYTRELERAMTTHLTATEDHPQEQLTRILDTALQTANMVVGLKPALHSKRPDSPELQRLTAEQTRLRIQIYNDPATDTSSLRTQRNRVRHQIRALCKQLASAELDAHVSRIEQLSESAQMYAAMKTLLRKPSRRTTLLDDNGRYILRRRTASNKIKSFFPKQFYDPMNPAVRPDTTPRPLTNPITAKELANAFRRLKNGRASGPDCIPGEVLKFGADILTSPLADTINRSFETGQQIQLGDGLLLCLPKPNKPRGECSSLRPIVLLTSIRKALALVVLHRIQGTVDRFISPHRSGFRPSRGTADAVWAHRWIAARAQRYREEFHILGIDLSHTFDTIDRDKLLSVLSQILPDDDARLIRLLLQDTRLSLRDGTATLPSFTSNIGIPQGDSLSPVLFTIYLEAALRDLSQELNQPNLLRQMIVYADDADFVCPDPISATLIEDQAPAILAKWSLQMNTSKTDHTVIRRRARADDDRTEHALDTNWRTTIKLGSALGDSEDLSRRKQLATLALRRLWAVWLRPRHASEATRIRLYNCYVRPVLLYNSGTWALTATELNSLDSFHRRQLRSVLGIRHPQHISSQALYRRCNVQPLSQLVKRNRWRLFGHILRRPRDIPANIYMDQYFEPSARAWPGKPRISLPRVLNEDLTQLNDNHRLTTATNLAWLRIIARNRSTWRTFTRKVLGQPGPPGNPQSTSLQ